MSETGVQAEPTLRPGGLRGLIADLLQMLRFWSWLPVPAFAFEGDPHRAPDFQRAARMVPIAGLIIALPAALIVVLFAPLLPAAAVAALAVACLALTTGAMHEDGLADTFDGLAGGRTRERRLEIMKDSRIGAYGAVAIGLSLILRVTLLAALVEELGALAATPLLALAALSRTLALLPLTMLPPARPDGAAAIVGRPSPQIFVSAMVIALAVLGGMAAIIDLPLWMAAVAVLGGFGAALLVTFWSLRAIGGQTGDIAGAAQQLAEIGLLLGLVVFAA
jgi:adenosylcobinamide-GDP ribazoletransferase